MTRNESRESQAAARDERERLRQVYDDYEASSETRSRWSDDNPGTREIVAERDRMLREALGVHGYLPLAKRSILDVGCGTGGVLRELERLGADPSRSSGIDLMPAYVEEARLAQPEATFVVGDAASLPFDDGAFDLVIAFTVFSSVLDRSVAAAIALHMTRVLKPGGAVVWYDLRYGNPGNHNVRGVGRTELTRLFPRLEPHVRTLTVLPPLARRLGVLSGVVYPALRAISPLRSHYGGVLVDRSVASVRGVGSPRGAG